MKNQIKTQGHLLLNFPQISNFKSLVVEQMWSEIDQNFKQFVQPEGSLFKLLASYKNFNQIEYMIAIRNADDDEDGIWHDDGSRVLAFSLSLNLHPENIKGGELLIRKKNSNDIIKISPQPFGTLVVFNTGVDLFEHKVCQVLEGQRIVLAGWCS